MTPPFDASTLLTVKHYLAQIGSLIDSLAQEDKADDILAAKLAPDMLNTGFHIGVASGFAARSLALPAGLPFPDIPAEINCATLKKHHGKITNLVAGIQVADLASPIRHRAGDANLEQEVSDYILRFALPNMIFHLSMAYAGLRQAGVEIGKADFDRLHIYTGPLD
ncbi:MAG: DUF1993 family protein [Pseudomonadota bacterium]